MDILVPHSWLKNYLKTSAKPEKVMEYLSLCGPSVERVTETDKGSKDYIYSIEVTTNRVDSASVYGIAREAAAILPRFDIKADLLPVEVKAKQKLVKSVNYLDTKVDPKLAPRFTAILIRDVKTKKSPDWVIDRLEKVGVRGINNVVDISNYLMHELGQPVHTFDWDKIKDQKMILRASKKGEKLTTLDGKVHELPGNDIVIEDGSGKIIDLCGIMGGENSAIDEKTKNVLLFVQTYNPLNIRRTSMALAHRTEAASLFEKGLDPENVELTIRRGIDLFVELCEGKPEKEILDIYPLPYKPTVVVTSLDFIDERLGASVSRKDVTNFLTSLGFKTEWKADELIVTVPSWRAADVSIPEDILEEVARLYGYFNLPSTLMSGNLPEPLADAPFAFESKIKQILKGYGGVEVYTYSMTSRAKADLNSNPSWVLKIRNPLGTDSEYMRLSLAPSLADAAKYNTNEKTPYFLYEIANVYLPTRGNLPEEKRMLGVVYANHDYAEAKGVLESLQNELGAVITQKAEDEQGFKKGQRLGLYTAKTLIGQFGVLDESNLIYFEFDLMALKAIFNPLSGYKPISKYPPQIEDMTFVWKPDLFMADVMGSIKYIDRHITDVELVSVYENSRTFRITYQSEKKTLTDAEVEKIRTKIIKNLEEEYNLFLKN
jgi:phenylalanyl-tRNA synthetase beta chain